MDRREVLKLIAAVTGYTVAGSYFFLSGCKSDNVAAIGTFTEKEIAFFDEVAETILPKTDTPGAKEAEVGKFMAFYSTDCYNESQLKVLKEGVGKLNDESEKKYGTSFISAGDSQKQELLTWLDSEAKKYNEENDGEPGKDHPPHYFTLMKQLVLLGFFTSKPGVKEVLRWVPVPGKYQGCIDYKNGEPSWA